jgi:Holliday junction resolvase RusA-like endonuclease
VISFRVDGIPVTQGSKKLVRGRMLEDAGPKLKRWRTAIGWAARQAMQGRPILPLSQPVKVTLGFTFQRPAKPSRSYPCGGGGQDVEKLVRAAHDAMTGIVWEDDSQCVDVRATKAYGVPGVEIQIGSLVEEGWR